MKEGLRISQQGIDLICSYEKFYPQLSLSDDGVPVIGFGHTGKDVRSCDIQKRSINREEAILLLKKDLLPIETALRVLVKEPLNQNQFDALCSYVFSLGVQKFQRSSILKELNKGHTQVAIWQLSQDFSQNGKTRAHLKARRHAEATLFNTPCRQESMQATRHKNTDLNTKLTNGELSLSDFISILIRDCHLALSQSQNSQLNPNTAYSSIPCVQEVSLHFITRVTSIKGGAETNPSALSPENASDKEPPEIFIQPTHDQNSNATLIEVRFKLRDRACADSSSPVHSSCPSSR